HGPQSATEDPRPGVASRGPRPPRLHLHQEPAAADVIERGGRQRLEDHRARENVAVPFLSGDLHRGPILEQNGTARREATRLALPRTCGTVRAVSASSADRTVVTLGTATPGGGFPVYGQAVADTVNEVDATLDVQPRNTKGSTENVPLLEAGSLDLALVQGEVVHEALTGVGRAPADLRVLAAMYSTPGMFVVRADAPYRSIEDLKGRPVAFGARGSGLIILARYVLDGLGLDRD